MTVDDDFPIEGGCTCKAVRYRMESNPLFVHCCHCRWCQRPADTPSVPEYYDLTDYWPQESLERVRALRAASCRTRDR